MIKHYWNDFEASFNSNILQYKRLALYMLHSKTSQFFVVVQ